MKQTFFKILFLVVAIIFCGCRKQEVPAATAETLVISESTTTTETTDATETTDEDTVYYGQGEISPDDIIRVPSSIVEVPDEMTSADEDIIYYGQDEISADDIIRVPSSTVEFPDEESTEINNWSNQKDETKTVLVLLLWKFVNILITILWF